MINMDNEILFTSASLLDFLQQIDELSDKDIIVNEDGSTIAVTIGASTYSINKSDAEDVEVEPSVVEEVSEINESTFEELDGVEYTPEVADEETVEGGIISEALMTLAVGGMVRLTSKLLGKDVADTIFKK